MQIKWFGQSCFEIKSDNKTLVFDPYSSDIGLNLPKLSADIVLVTHNHPDHNNIKAVSSKSGKEPFVISNPGEYEVSGIKIDGVSSFHDKSHGSERGKNTIYIADIEDIRVCHLGDQGALLEDKELEAIGEVDILFVPVGNDTCYDAEAAAKVANALEPKIVIPMAFKSDNDPKAKPVEEFLKEMGAKVQPEKKLIIKKKTLPEEGTQVMVVEKE